MVLLFFRALRSVEVIATKAYHPSGVVTVTIIYDVSKITILGSLF
jgi:hypothetical protein